LMHNRRRFLPKQKKRQVLAKNVQCIKKISG
jgi:hypothetical protein